MRKPGLPHAWAILAILAFAGVASAKELRFAIAGDPRTFDPLQVAESNAETVRYLTAGVLLRINRGTDQIEPELAESWKVTENGRVIWFRLRPKLQFSDGTPLNAQTVANTLRRALDPKELSPAGEPFRIEHGAPAVTVNSPLELTIRYPSPKASLDRLFDALGITPPSPGALPASAGPYKIAEYRRGNYIRLERNPYYWKRDSSGRQLPYIDSVRLDIQQNRDIELARFLRGELHLVNKLEAEAFARLQRNQPQAARSLGASYDLEFLWFNQAPVKTLLPWKRQWFTSAAFRHAISAAIHRDDLARLAFRGHAHAAYGPISEANRFWFNTGLRRTVVDPLKSLASEGFALRGGSLFDRQGHPVEFSLVTQSGNRTRERMATLIQADLRNIGIKVNVVTLEFGSLVERISRSLDYEAALLGFSNVAEDPSEDMNVWLSSGAQHAWWPAQKTPATKWEAEIDMLERKQAASGSRAERKKAIDEVQRIVLEQEPIIYLVNPDYLCAISPRLKGVKPAVSPPQLLWNVEWLRLD